jgi:hypothetical protein
VEFVASTTAPTIRCRASPMWPEHWLRIKGALVARALNSNATVSPAPAILHQAFWSRSALASLRSPVSRPSANHE